MPHARARAGVGLLLLGACLVYYPMVHLHEQCPNNSARLSFASSTYCVCNAQHRCEGEQCVAGAIVLENGHFSGFAVSCLGCQCVAPTSPEPSPPPTPAAPALRRVPLALRSVVDQRSSADGPVGAADVRRKASVSAAGQRAGSLHANATVPRAPSAHSSADTTTSTASSITTTTRPRAATHTTTTTTRATTRATRATTTTTMTATTIPITTTTITTITTMTSTITTTRTATTSAKSQTSPKKRAATLLRTNGTIGTSVRKTVTARTPTLFWTGTTARTATVTTTVTRQRRKGTMITALSKRSQARLTRDVARATGTTKATTTKTATTATNTTTTTATATATATATMMSTTADTTATTTATATAAAATTATTTEEASTTPAPSAVAKVATDSAADTDNASPGSPTTASPTTTAATPTTTASPTTTTATATATTTATPTTTAAAQPTASDVRLERCLHLKMTYRVSPGVSWGSLPSKLQAEWDKTKCNDFASRYPRNTTAVVTVAVASAGEHIDCVASRATVEGDPDALKAWEQKGCDFYYYRITQALSIADGCNATATLYYTIAILTPLSTRGLATATLASMPLWNTLLPSLRATWASARGRTVGFDFYFGYDAGDPLLDTPAGPDAFMNLFAETMSNVTEPVRMRLVAINTHGVKGAPSWAVGVLAQMAVHDGADYLFQVNDDTEMISSGWADKLPDKLAASGHVGVTGPLDLRNPHILTQSFVHRAHVAAFPRFFPKPFRNWWSDDWISSVYGPHATLKSTIEAMHAPKKATARMAGGSIQRYHTSTPIFGDFVYNDKYGIDAFVRMMVDQHQPVIAALKTRPDLRTVTRHACIPFSSDLVGQPLQYHTELV